MSKAPYLAFPLLLLAACSNTPPRLEPIDDATGKVDAVLEFDVYGADVDDDDLAFRVVIDGAESDLLSQVSNNQAHFRWIPTPGDVGVHQADFFLTDGVEEVSERITITVLDREGGGDGPVFVSPDRYLLDVSTEPSIEFTIEVKEDSTTDVTIELVRSIDGAMFHGQPATDGAQAYGKRANFFWAPTEAQKATSQHFLSVRAFDGDGRSADQDIAIVLRGVDGSCTTQPPELEHTPLSDRPSSGGFPIEVTVTDFETDILEATAFFSLVPSPADADFRSVALLQDGDLWTGTIPDPGLDPGAIATVTYYLCARDDDDPTTEGDPDAGDRCDRLACTPRYTFLASGPAGGLCARCATSADCPAGSSCLDEAGARLCVPDGDSCQGGGGGLCDPCETHGDCGGLDDYCLSNGETGESFCGVDCAEGQPCGAGNVCAELGGGVSQCVPEAFTCQASGGAGLCEPCETRADCGGDRDYCLQAADGSLFCGQDCSDGFGCPDGYDCADLTAFEPGLFQCAPRSGSCGAGGGARAPGPGELVVNEVLADPPPGSDPNGDGTASTVNDEFVELLNLSAAELDLTGVTIDDAAADQAVRFTFPAGTTVGPGRAVLVFGGGDPALFGSFGGSQAFRAPQGLGLNNAGDTLSVRDAGGNLLVQATFGADGGEDQSLTLSPDGAGLSFALHGAVAAAPYSPGTQTCGNPFPVAAQPCGGGGGCVGGDRDGEPNDTLETATCLSALPAELAGHLDHQPASEPPGPDASDFFSFEVSAGQLVTVATYPGAAPDVSDTVLFLHDETGALVAEHDDNDVQAGDYYSTLEHAAASAGTYVVEVRAYRSASRATAGSYELRVEAR